MSAIADTTFGIAALQLALSPGDNLERVSSEIDALCRRMPWVRMALLPELCIYGAGVGRAVPLPGPVEAHLQDVARRNGIWLIPGSLYEADGGRVYNTTPVIAPDGRVVGRFRKLFPFLPYEKGVTPGCEFLTFDVEGAGRFGVSICYDMWFPETTRSLIHLGAEVILHPVMTATIDRDVEIAMARATAASNQCYVVDVNNTGDLGTGRSVICGPGGELVHQAGSGREIIAFEVDFSYVRRVREHGWQGLGQVLKSHRDQAVVFPAYNAPAQASAALTALGPLVIPALPAGPKSP